MNVHRLTSNMKVGLVFANDLCHLSRPLPYNSLILRVTIIDSSTTICMVHDLYSDKFQISNHQDPKGVKNN